MGLSVQHVLLDGASQAVGASATNQVVSQEFTLTGEGISRGVRIDIKCASVTDTTALLAKLQTSPVGGSGASYADVDATDLKADITADGWVSIAANSAWSNVADKFPLQAHARIVVTTGADDAVTVTDIVVTQPD